MARTLSLVFLLAVVVGCQSGGGGRDSGAAPPRFAPFRPLKTSPLPDRGGMAVEQDRLHGRNPIGRYDESDPQEKYRGLADRFGPTGR